MLEFSRIVPKTYDARLSIGGQLLASSRMGRLEVFDVPEMRPRFSVPFDYPGGARHR